MSEIRWYREAAAIRPKIIRSSSCILFVEVHNVFNYELCWFGYQLRRI